MPRFFAIVPAAGAGSRFGAARPKQYLDLLGRPLLFHTLQALVSCPEIERVWVVLSPDDTEWSQYDWQPLGSKLETVRCGGQTRAESVSNGLLAAAMVAQEEDWVLVHDAARPCLNREMLQNMFAELSDDPVGGILAVPVADTLKRSDEQQRVDRTISREALWQAQTPQMFRYGLLKSALSACQNVTDEAGAIEAYGFKPRLVAGDATNLKVTYPADLALAALILRGRK